VFFFFYYKLMHLLKRIMANFKEKDTKHYTFLPDTELIIIM